MTEPAFPVVTARGEARIEVPPDSASLSGAITATRPKKAAALSAVAAAQARLAEDVQAMGGVPRDAGSARQPLSWLAYPAGTQAEGDKTTGEYKLTGNITARVAIEITIRAFSQLEDLSTLLARHELLEVHQVNWQADWDNPPANWPSQAVLAGQRSSSNV